MSSPLPTVVELLDRGLTAGHHAGAQLYVSLRGQRVAELVLGESAAGVAMTATTLMPWLSSGKPATAIAVAQQWERQKLRLDDPVALFIPEFGERGKEAVTVRHVLTHTGGFRSLVDLGHVDSTWDLTLGKICRARLERDWLPGRRAAYHAQSGWFVLAEIVRRLTVEPFDDYVRREVFEPLDMRDSWLTLTPERAASYGDRLATLYDTSCGHQVAAYPWLAKHGAAICVPGASARGPMSDLGRLYEGLLAMLSSASEGIVSAQTAEALVSRQRAGLTDETFHHIVDWGLGFIVCSNQYGPETVPYGFGRHCSPRAFGHSGSQSSIGFADPDRGLVVALAVNGMPGEDIHQPRFRELATAIYEDLELD